MSTDALIETQTAAGLITDFKCYNITDHHVSIGSSKCCSYVHHISHPFSPSKHPARLAPPHAESHPSGDAEAQATVRIGPDQGAVVGRTSGGEVERGAGHSWLCQLFGGVLGRLGHYQPLRWYSFRPCTTWRQRSRSTITHMYRAAFSLLAKRQTGKHPPWRCPDVDAWPWSSIGR